jgi:hypothetical protein
LGNNVLALTFPGGKRATQTIAATAGNVTINLSPGTGKRWLVLRGRIGLTTDATVANRYLVIHTTDGTNLTESLASTAAVVASQTEYISLGEALVTKSGALGGDNYYIGMMPVLLEGADQLRITVTAGVVGDSYSGYFVVLEL